MPMGTYFQKRTRKDASFSEEKSSKKTFGLGGEGLDARIYKRIFAR
jgi:hypothetical protein